MGMRRAVGALFLAVLVVAASAAAGPRGQWTRLPGTVINFAEPGVARTSDGVLHVLYTRRNGSKEDLIRVGVAANGRVGGDTVALGGWSAMSHPDLLRMPDGSLRAFFGGIRSTSPGETNNAMNTATAPAAGRPWTLKPGKAAQAPYAYATGVAGAGLAEDGTPISTWSGTPGLGFHYGIDANTPDGRIPQTGCCLYTPEIAVDSASGQAWVGFHSNEDAGPGLYVNAIGAGGPQGGRRLAPGSVTNKSSIYPGNRTSLTGRIGAGGVFLFFGQGYPSFKTLALWKVDTARPQIVIKADRNEHANVAAAPEGRLWLMWEVNGTIFAARTNKAATRVGAVNRLRAPGSRTVYRLNGEGSAGLLDLIVNDGRALWHQQVWPKLQLAASRSGRTIVFRVLDAGDPVAGATVKAGGRTLRTAANGRARLARARPGRVKATASKAGYAPASLTVR
ncbi:MAG: carboxypeptidase-like regulatory domain-containing protein [Gaiellaceae bacterium]